MVKNVVILTGAGISAESGIRTFRASDGLWEDHRVEDVATPEGFIRDPELVQRFYNERRRKLLSPEIKPNPAHTALADFEKRFTNQDGNQFLLVTQNIDNLHERAGSRNVLHMHGEVLKVRCRSCNYLIDWEGDLSLDDRCPNCPDNVNLSPHVVWFGEMPLEMGRIEEALSEADLFISIGTSGNVYPAAGFVNLASHHGAKTVEINLDATEKATAFDDGYYGKASETVPKFLQSID